MADFSNIIQEINADINTNGVGAITGAKLNAVLRDMIAAIDAEKQDPLTIDATPTEGSTNPVQSGGMFDALNNLYQALSVSDSSLFGGVVRPSDSPTYGDDYRYCYLALQAGRYSNFNNYEVESNALLFYWLGNNWGYISLWNTNQFIDRIMSLKANKVDGATQGNLAGLDSEGNLTDSGIAASDVATTADLAGKQDTISDLATIRSGAAAGATAVQPSDLATVATSGSYNDLLNKPTIPAAQVNSDWNANSGVTQILNKPTIPDVSGKADKVGGATNGDFAGLDANGNLTDSGKKASDFATPIPVVDASTIPASMEPNKLYKYGTLSGDTVFPSLATPTDQSRANVYWWKFTTPASTINVQMPSSITIWNGGQAPTIDPSTTYEITVEDGFGTCIKS